MAQAAVLTVNAFPNGIDTTTRELIVYGLVTFTGTGGYTTGGIPLNWKQLTNPDGTPLPINQSAPFLVYFQPLDGSLVQYQWSNAANTLFAQTAGAQVASGTTISGVIAFEAHFAKNI